MNMYLFITVFVGNGSRVEEHEICYLSPAQAALHAFEIRQKYYQSKRIFSGVEVYKLKHLGTVK